MTLSASGQTGRGPLRAHLCFLPWLYLTWGSLEPFVGQPSNPGQSLLMSNEATTTSLRNTERCDAFSRMCDAFSS